MTVELVGRSIDDQTRVDMVLVEHPDGTSTPWSDREPLDRICADLGYGTTCTGGFRDLRSTILRDFTSTGREDLYDTIRVLGPGERTLWEGRLQAKPKSTDRGGVMTPAAVGWSSHLEDDEAVSAPMLDRGLTRWGPLPLDRRQAIVAASYKVADGGTGWHSQAGPTIDLTAPGSHWDTAPGRPFAALTYDAGPGLKFRRVEFRVHRFGATSPPGSGWQFLALGADSADMTADPEVQSGYDALGDGSAASYQAARDHRYLELSASYPLAPAGNADVTEYGWHAYAMAVLGTHGLPLRPGAGTHPDGQDMSGLHVSDMLAWLLPLGAPKLTFTTGPAGSIEPTGTAVAHFWPDAPTTMAELVNQLNAFHGRDWGVWERRRFWYWTPGLGPSRTWIASTTGDSDTKLTLNVDGDSAENIWTGVYVRYQDFAGRSYAVGPPGSPADEISQQLVDQHLENPAVAHDLRRIGVLELSQPVTSAGARAIGQMWLRQKNLATRKGTANKSGLIQDADDHSWHPVSHVRGGDYLRVRGLDGPDRKIIDTDYDQTSVTAQWSLDNSADVITRILEAIGASLTGVLS